MKDQGFHRDKQSFFDALYIRYEIPLKRMPLKCVCGVSYTMDHSQEGFVTIRHTINCFLVKMKICRNKGFQPISQILLQPRAESKMKQIRKGELVNQIEHGSFTPLVFICFGGMSQKCFFQERCQSLPRRETTKLVLYLIVPLPPF